MLEFCSFTVFTTRGPFNHADNILTGESMFSSESCLRCTADMEPLRMSPAYFDNLMADLSRRMGAWQPHDRRRSDFATAVEDSERSTKVEEVTESRGVAKMRAASDEQDGDAEAWDSHVEADHERREKERVRRLMNSERGSPEDSVWRYFDSPKAVVESNDVPETPEAAAFSSADTDSGVDADDEWSDE